MGRLADIHGALASTVLCIVGLTEASQTLPASGGQTMGAEITELQESAGPTPSLVGEEAEAPGG